MIRGKKNFLPSVQLQLGLGLMFRLDEESAERHQLEMKEKRSTRYNSMASSLNEQQTSEPVKEEMPENDFAEQIELNKDGKHDEEEEEENEEEYPDVEVSISLFK